MTGAHFDPVVNGVLAPVADVRVVAGLAELDALLRLEATGGRSVDCLELFGHSYGPDSVLVIGNDEINPFEWQVELALGRLRTALGDCRCREVRLLGCETAATEAGRRAIERISELVGVPVRGTTVSLGPGDVGRVGLAESFERYLWPNAIG